VGFQANKLHRVLADLNENARKNKSLRDLFALAECRQIFSVGEFAGHRMTLSHH
jgi:hypothetical protein